jgi:WD40 repeat protein
VSKLPDEPTRIPDVTDESTGTASARAGLLHALLAAGADELTERYELRGELGRGGMGEVVEAFDRRLRREVALKRLRVTTAQQLDAQRFVREAQLSSRLDHPNVLPVHDLGVGPDGTLFISMKRLHGRTLAEILRSGETWSLHRRLDVFLKVCDAVAYAHAHGVLHRDLKPSNVMIGAFREVWVLDWGLAKQIGEAEAPQPGGASSSGEEGEHITTGGSVMGTPGWLSPEQARGEHDRVDPRSDVFSLGVLLYTLLTGTPPFPGRGRAAVEAVVKGTFDPPRVRKPGVSWELDAVVRRAMAYRPEDRFASVDELRAEVQRWVEGQTLQTLHYGPTQRLAKWGGRYWRGLLATAVAVTLLTSAALVGAGLWLLSVSAARDRALLAEDEAVAAERAAQLALGHAGVQLARAQADLGRLEDALSELERAEAVLVAQGASTQGVGLVRSVLASRFTPPELVVTGSPGNRAALSAAGDELVVIHPDRRIRRLGLPAGEVRAEHTPLREGEGIAGLGFRAGVPVVAVYLSDAIEVRDLDGAPLAPPVPIAPEPPLPNVFLAEDLLVVVDPDGSGSRLQHLADGAVVPLPGALVQAVAADGSRVAGAVRGKPTEGLVVWDAVTGQVVAKREPGLDFALSADGRWLAVHEGPVVTVADVDTGAVRWTTESLPGVRLAFSRGGDVLVAAGADDRLRVLDAADGRLLGERRMLGGLNASRGRLLVARDADRVLAFQDGEIRVWTPGDARDEPWLQASEQNLTNLAVSPDGLLAASAGWDGVVRLWDWRSRALLRAVTTAPEGVRDVVFSPDGSRLLTADRDGKGRIIDPVTGQVLQVLTIPGATLALACQYVDGAPVVAFDDGTVAAFADDGAVAWSIRGEIGRVWSLLPSPGGDRLLVVGRERHQPVAELWSLADRTKLLTGPTLNAGYRAAFAPDGGSFVVTTHEGLLLRFTGADPEPQIVPLRDEALQAIGYSPDGSMLAVGAYDGQLELLDAATLERVQSVPLHERSIVDLQWVPGEDTVLTGSGDGRIGWFDARRWERTAGTTRRWAPGEPDLVADGAAWLLLGEGAAYRSSWAWAVTCHERAEAAGAVVPPLDRARALWAVGRRDEARAALDRVTEDAPSLRVWRAAPGAPAPAVAP